MSLDRAHRHLVLLLAALGWAGPLQRWTAEQWSRNVRLADRPTIRWTQRERLDVISAQRVEGSDLYEVLHGDGRIERMFLVIYSDNGEVEAA